MDSRYLHLLVEHFPIVLGLGGALGVLLAWPTRRRPVWNFGLTCTVLAGVMAIPAYFSGVAAVDATHTMPYMGRDTIQMHVQAARLATVLLIAAAAVALYTLRRISRRPAPGKTVFPAWLQILVVITAVAAAVTTIYAGLNGIRFAHPASASIVPATAHGSSPVNS